MLCFIAIWSNVRGCQRWREGKYIQAIVLATIGAYTALLILTKLREIL